MKHNKWIEMKLGEIATEYGEGEPLDDDDVDDLMAILKIKVNFHQGNITEEEYEEAIAELQPLRGVLVATFVSVWDDSSEIRTRCLYDDYHKYIKSVETSEETPEGMLTREYIIVNNEELDVCMECHEGILETKMVPHPENEGDKTLYEIRGCSVCGEDA